MDLLNQPETRAFRKSGRRASNHQNRCNVTCKSPGVSSKQQLLFSCLVVLLMGTACEASSSKIWQPLVAFQTVIQLRDVMLLTDEGVVQIWRTFNKCGQKKCVKGKIGSQCITKGGEANVLSDSYDDLVKEDVVTVIAINGHDVKVQDSTKKQHIVKKNHLSALCTTCNGSGMRGVLPDSIKCKILFEHAPGGIMGKSQEAGPPEDPTYRVIFPDYPWKRIDNLPKRLLSNLRYARFRTSRKQFKKTVNSLGKFKELSNNTTANYEKTVGDRVIVSTGGEWTSGNKQKKKTFHCVNIDEWNNPESFTPPDYCHFREGNGKLLGGSTEPLNLFRYLRWFPLTSRKCRTCNELTVGGRAMPSDSYLSNQGQDFGEVTVRTIKWNWFGLSNGGVVVEDSNGNQPTDSDGNPLMLKKGDLTPLNVKGKDEMCKFCRDTCGTCDGKGKTDDLPKCTSCGGTGRIATGRVIKNEVELCRECPRREIKPNCETCKGFGQVKVWCNRAEGINPTNPNENTRFEENMHERSEYSTFNYKIGEVVFLGREGTVTVTTNTKCKIVFRELRGTKPLTKEHWIVCEECTNGETEEGETCEQCDGKGVVTKCLCMKKEFRINRMKADGGADSEEGPDIVNGGVHYHCEECKEKPEIQKKKCKACKGTGIHIFICDLCAAGHFNMEEDKKWYTVKILSRNPKGKKTLKIPEEYIITKAQRDWLLAEKERKDLNSNLQKAQDNKRKHQLVRKSLTRQIFGPPESSSKMPKRKKAIGPQRRPMNEVHPVHDRIVIRLNENKKRIGNQLTTAILSNVNVKPDTVMIGPQRSPSRQQQKRIGNQLTRGILSHLKTGRRLSEVDRLHRRIQQQTAYMQRERQ